MKLSSPILGFMLASVGVHAGLMMTSYNQTDITLPGSTGSVMAVKIKEYLQKESHLLPEKTEEKTISTTVNQAQVKKYSTKAFKQTNEKQHQASSTNKKNTVSKARVVSLIYRELNNHFTYPKIAQRRNWQGQVLLAFRLSSNGNIEDIKINHSSGYNILDQAAIISLKKIGQLPQTSSWLVNGMEIQIPIIYQLTKG